MNRRRSRYAPTFCLVNEILESRIVLSAIAPQSAAEVATRPGHAAGTDTTLAVAAGTLGQPITVTVTVRANASAGAPTGTVNIVSQGNVIQTLTLSPTTSTNAKYAYSQATYTLTPQPGGTALFFGRHTLTADFVPTGGFQASRATKAFTVSKPDYTTLAGGVKVATLVPGSGPQIQSGQTANVLYTGYLASNGRVFDDSMNHGDTPLSFTLSAGQVIPGFETGTLGMQAGETRIVEIPPAQAYGDEANGPIPANSTLIFVLTLESIS